MSTGFPDPARTASLTVSLTVSLPGGIAALHRPARGTRRAGLVMAQEIFGLNANMVALADRFAADGFEVLAPDYFGRIAPGFTAAHDPDGIQKGLAAVRATGWDQVAADTQAAIDWLRRTGGPVFVTGFCWGGTVAWLAAQHCSGLAAAAGFYGRLITTLLDRPPLVPVQLHYGDRDPGIPASDVDRVRTAWPEVPVLVWPAGHGFFSDRGADHDPEVAARAWEAAERFFAGHGLAMPPPGREAALP